VTPHLPVHTAEAEYEKFNSGKKDNDSRYLSLMLQEIDGAFEANHHRQNGSEDKNKNVYIQEMPVTQILNALYQRKIFEGFNYRSPSI